MTFAASKQRATKAILGGETAGVLGVVFDRLYLLRNQLVHGGATWNSKVNRQQVRDGANLMGSLVPIVIGVMVERPEAGFGEAAFPVVYGVWCVGWNCVWPAAAGRGPPYGADRHYCVGGRALRLEAPRGTLWS